jgi:hypothetical protein
MEDNTQTFEAFIEKYKSALDTLLIITKERQDESDRRKARVEDNRKHDPADIAGGLSEDEREVAKQRISSFIDNEEDYHKKRIPSFKELENYREARDTYNLFCRNYNDKLVNLKNYHLAALARDIEDLELRSSPEYKTIQMNLNRMKFELITGN